MMDDEALEQFGRSLGHATEHHTAGALDAALDELGWRDALADDPRAAISILFERQGRANASSAALGCVVAHALSLDGPATGVVLPAMGRWDPPGQLDGGDLRVNGLATAGVTGLESVVVVASAGADDIVVTVPTSSLRVFAVEGLDPGLGLCRVTTERVGPATGPEAPGSGWASAVALGRLAVAHELVGASRTMLELACEHAGGRIQFGRPISSFQAIRHRLAESLVAIELADAALEAAWLGGGGGTAAMAKSTAGSQARTVARHCQQVLAGIGFTTEHPLHRYVRRTLVLDGLLGTAASLSRALGDQLVASRQLPPLLPL